MFNNEIMEDNTIIKNKIGWKQLKQYHKNPPKIPFPKGITIYNKYKNHIKNINNIYNFLLNNLFKNNDFFIIKNADFPYYVSDYIIHKILWFNPKFYKNINIDYLFVDKILKKYKKYIVFQNIFNNRSIKNITHFHFFIFNI